MTSKNVMDRGDAIEYLEDKDLIQGPLQGGLLFQAETGSWEHGNYL
jgi:hypothetical protein